ncbi:uncharacterized protein [Coffea arabica]|uniref:C3H1-type domain-containing protein n=1 Tax=Coffea arabica TaxID=13443 RepID=A0ABM4V076_COFAR
MYITVLFTYLSDPIHSSPRLLLVQAKFFQSEDCLSEVGREPPGNPHEKVSNENIAIADGFPGSSVGSYPNPLSHKGVSHIPQIPWRTPPRFDLKFECHVAAGEESEEVEVQKHREMRVHEAVYPHFSAVPHCPSISSDVEAEHFDDWHTPVIPVTAIEEAAETDCLAKPEPAKLPQSPSTSEIFDIPQCKSLLSRELSKGKKSDHAPLQDLDGPMVAAAAATTAIMKSKEPPSLIDPELLIKLLSNPELVQKLIDERRLASDTTTRTSGSKTVESSVHRPSAKGSFLFEESTIESYKPDNPRTGFIHRPSKVKCSPAAPSRIRAQLASTETGPTFAWDEIEQLLHFQSSTIVSLVQKSTTENTHPGNAGIEAVLRPGNQPLAVKAETGTGLGPKQVTTSISLLSSKSDLPSQNSNYEVFQRADVGNMSLLKASRALSSSIHDVLSKKSTGRYIQLADDGHMAVPRLVKRPQANNIEIGACSRSMTVAPLVPLLSSNPDFPGKNFMKGHSQLGNFRDLSVPRFVKPNLAGSSISGTAFEPKKVTPSVPLSSVLPDFSKKSSGEHGALLYTSFPEPAVERHSHTFPRMQSESLVDRLDTAYIAPRLGTSPVPGSLAEVYRLKKLIEEHGSHDRAGNDYVGEIPAPSSVPGAEHPSFPLEPLRKDISYFQSLIRQHGEEKGSQDDELSLYGISHNHLQSKESDRKYKRTCKFYNSSMGCRNGSSCPYEHDVPGQWRSDVVLEVPGAKRLKLGGSFTGRT